MRTRGIPAASAKRAMTVTHILSCAASNKLLLLFDHEFARPADRADVVVDEDQCCVFEVF
ncbi:hypothetical protein [Acidithrix ferrooxidans]|uniref:hypothetical protein n=1 Tax=Acidithrix ferrooxidans TaxID=1280514 RepID=UPI001269F432|nr:hypothetical protein [Acidithrix ferrooxidans]